MEKGIANLIKVIEKGVISDAVTSRLEKLEKDKANLKEAMEAKESTQAGAEIVLLSFLQGNYHFLILYLLLNRIPCLALLPVGSHLPKA